MAQQLSDPLSILNIALSPRHRFHVGGIGNDQLEVAFQKIVNRHPVIAGRFHGHVSGPATFKPLDHFHQLWCRSPKTFDFTDHLFAKGSF